MSETTSLADKVILVTGASRGIGRAAAQEAARRGAHVVAVARTVGGLEELDDEIKALGREATLVPFDLTDGDGIDRLGAAIFERWGHLDGMIANAGVLGILTPVAHLDPVEYERAFAVNVAANYRLIRSMDLLLRQAEAGRAVFVSSSSSQSARAFWGVYAAAKAAMEAFVKSYAAEVADTRVRVNLFWPGAVRTAMRARAFPAEDPMTLPEPAEVAPKLVDMILPDFEANRSLYDFERDALRPL